MAVQQLGQKVWYSLEGTGYIMLDVTEHITPLKPMEIDRQKLLPKPEYHCSLVAARKLANDKTSEEMIVNFVKKFLKTNKIRFDSLTDEVYVCRKEKEVTIIIGAKITGLENLRKELQKIIPHYTPLFPHVTMLKSENSRYGIGINSQIELKNRCVKVEKSKYNQILKQ